MMWKKLIPVQNATIRRILQVDFRNISISKILKKDHYEVLGLDKDASLADIKNAYFELSKKYHPDRIAATDQNLTKFREITAAYEVLSNEQSRKLYDIGIIKDDRDDFDPSDPIVKFYKERYERKEAKSAEDLNAWTENFIKQSRVETFEKSELFRNSKRNFEALRDPTASMPFVFVSVIIICSMFLADYENNKVSKFLKQLLST